MTRSKVEMDRYKRSELALSIDRTNGLEHTRL